MIPVKPKIFDKRSVNIQSFKHRLCNLICEMFTDQFLPKPLCFLLVIWSHLQIFSLFVDPTNDFISVHKVPTDPLPVEDFIIDLSIFCKFSTLYQIYSNSLPLFLILFSALGILSLFFSFTFLTLLFKKDSSFYRTSKLFRILRIFGIAYVPFFFLSAHIAFTIATFSLADQSEFKLFREQSLENSNLILMMAFGVILMISNSFNGFLLALYGFNPIDDNSKNLLSRSDNTGERIFFVVKFIFPFLSFGGLIDSAPGTVIRTGFMFFIVLSNFYYEYKTIPYYCEQISNLSLRLKSMTLLSSFAVWLISLMVITETGANQAGFVLAVFISPMLMKIIVNKAHLRIYGAMLTDPRQIRTPNEMLQQAIGFNHFILKINGSDKKIKTSNLKAEFLLQGLIYKHIKECVDTGCICKKEKKLFDPATQKYYNPKENPAKDRVFLLHYGRMLFQIGNQRFKDNLKLKVRQAYYEAVNLRFAHQAFIILQNLGKADLNFDEMLLISFTRKKIIQIIINKYDERIPGLNLEETKSTELIDLKYILIIEDRMNVFREKITRALDLTISLWGQLKLSTINLLLISKMHSNLEELAGEIDESWKSFQGYGHVLEEFYNLLYGLYLMNIRNELIEGPKKIKRAYINSLAKRSRSKIKKGISANTIYDSNSVTILLNGNKNALGTIIRISSTCETVFGKRMEELQDQNIRELLPRIYHHSHNEYLHSYLETGEELIFNQHRETFARHAKGYTFPINLYVKINPDLERGITYIGVIKPIVNFDYYVVVDVDGVIDSMSENLSTELKINPLYFSQEKVKISSICPEIEEVLNAFNSKAQDLYGQAVLEAQYSFQRKQTESKPYELILNSLNDDDLNQDGNFNVENKYNYFFEVFSREHGAKITMMIPPNVKEHPLNAKLNKNEEKGIFGSNSEKITEINYLCQIKDVVHKGKQIVRMLHLKSTIQNDEEDLNDLNGDISLAEKFVRKHRKQTKKTIRYSNITFGKMADVAVGLKKTISDSPPSKKSQFSIVQDSLPTLSKLQVIVAEPSEAERSEVGVSRSILESNHIRTEYEVDNTIMFDTNALNIHNSTQYLNLYADTTDKDTNGNAKETKLNTSILNNSAAPLNLELVNNPTPDTEEAVRNRTASQLKMWKLFRHGNSNVHNSQVKKSVELSKSRGHDFALYANVGLRDDDRSSTMSKTSQSQGFNRLYVKSIGEPHYSFSYHVITKTMLLVLLLNLILSIVVYYVNVSSMSETETYIQVQRTTSNLNFYSLAMFRRYKAIQLLVDGIYTNDKFTRFDLPDYYEFGQALLRNYTSLFDLNNQNFYQQLFSFDVEFVDSIYGINLPLITYDSINKKTTKSNVDFFQKVNFILNLLNECVKYNYQQTIVNQDNILSKVNEMVINTADELLIACNQIQSIVGEKISENVDLILNTSVTLCLIIISIMALVFFSFIVFFYQLASEKENCLQTLAMIDPHDLDGKYDFFTKFKSLVYESGISTDVLMKGFQEQYALLGIVPKNTGKRHMKKNTSNKGLYRWIISDILKIFLIFLTSIIYFTYSMVDFTTYIKKNSVISDQIEITQTTMQNQTYLWESVRLLYVDNGTGSVLSSAPIDVYEEYYTGLKDITAISNAYLGNDKPYDTYLRELLDSDLCDVVNNTFCATLAKGTLRNGILEFDSYLLNVFTTLYNQWLSIRYTSYDIQKYSEQNDFLEVEYIIPTLMRPKYVQISDYLQKQFIANNTNKKNSSQAGLGAFVSIVIVLCVAIWGPLVRYLENNQKLNKAVFRLIPPDIVLRNSYIKLRFKKYSKSLSAYKF